MLPLGDVVALVVSQPLGPVDSRAAISAKLELLGARIAHRLGKHVTHVVFQRVRNSTPQERQAEESEIRNLYDKLAKLDTAMALVSPLWVQSCASENRRVPEAAYVVPKPTDGLFTFNGTPGSGSGTKRPARRRSTFRRKPEDYEVDVTDPLYSSSQQLKGGITAGNNAEEVASPTPARFGAASRNDFAGPSQAIGDEDFGVSGTQVAAEMLTGLGNDSMGGAHAALIALKTDNAIQQPRGSSTKRRGGGRTPAVSKRGTRPRSAVEAGKTPTTAKKAARGRASKSAPQPALKTGGQARAASRLRPKPSENTAAPISAAIEPAAEARAEDTGQAQDGSAAAELADDPMVISPDRTSRPPAERGNALAKEKSDRLVRAAKLAMPLREVKSRVEMQMPILRTSGLSLTEKNATPLPPAGPKIPVPPVRRVISPWTVAPGTAKRGLPSAARSAFKTPAERPARPEAWSQPRPWDPKPDVTPPEPSVVRDGDTSPTAAEEPRKADEPIVIPDSDGEEAAAEYHTAESGADAIGSEDEPVQGNLALSSVEPSIQDLARHAIKCLRGLRLCPEGSEERITHLVLDKERRTLKVLLAITNGAHFVTPAWLTASLEANRWLPVAPFRPQVRFMEAADRSRRVVFSSHPKPLEGQTVFVESQEQADKSLPSNSAVLKRVAAALGAKVVTRQRASLCIVSGAAPKKPELLPPGARAVREEWLLDVAEHYRLPETDVWNL